MNETSTAKQAMGKRAVCTIVAKNYVSFARVLAASVGEHNPDVDVFVLLVDDWERWVMPKDECFRIVSIGEIGLPDVDRMAFQYDVVAFSTAVKPFLLAHLLKQGYEKVLYIDPDILVVNSLGPLFERLDSSNFLLTPHTDTDFPRDGQVPDERFLMVHGVFNLGFFGLRAGAVPDEFLDWWQDKLLTKCVRDFASGYFVDQKFLDIGFLFFPGFYIEHNPGCNVAYWNLHARTLSRRDGIWFSNEQPLVFFHFSSFKADRPEVLSPNTSRLRLEARPDLQPLFAEYHRRLLAAGFQTTRTWPYGYGFFRDGEPISNETREQFRLAAMKGEMVADPFASRRLHQRDELQKRQSPWFGILRNLMPPVLWRGIKMLLGAGRKSEN